MSPEVLSSIIGGRICMDILRKTERKCSKPCVVASCEPPRINCFCYFFSPICNLKKLFIVAVAVLLRKPPVQIFVVAVF